MLTYHTHTHTSLLLALFELSLSAHFRPNDGSLPDEGFIWLTVKLEEWQADLHMFSLYLPFHAVGQWHDTQISIM